MARRLMRATGRDLEAWVADARASGLRRAEEVLAWLTGEHSLAEELAWLVIEAWRRR